VLGNLFILTKDGQKFEAFSKFIFELLHVKIKETRYSENSPGGRYVIGEALGLRMKLEEADDSEFPDYEFLLSFRPEINWAAADLHSLDGLADIIAKQIARSGMKIARPLEFGKGTSITVEYNDEAR
jgi:hypothetical protein